MKKYKICVYAISKNEEKFVDRWYESVKEADEVYVLDTGSTDNTIKKLQEHNVMVKQEIINPWRFDVARNKSLELVPDDTDICVCIDLDEVLEKGWRKKLEDNWEENTTQAIYTYNWSFDDMGKPNVTFYYEKIHSRKDYTWTHPVHEILTYIGNGQENKKLIADIILNHYPDKTKSRSSYLPLLELSVREDPENDRNTHYLGREYMYYQEWDKAIETLEKHLSLKKATWKDERSASMRFIARCYSNKGNLTQARIWLEKAINEAPYLREAYTEYGILEYNNKNYKDAIIYLNKALDIKDKYLSYINETFCWDNTIYDLLSICYFNIFDLKNSLYYATKAYNMNKNDSRIKNNKELIESYL
jgi:tetratricopeptide (TPR) repeat protein